jgi:hypothetical protein
MTEELGKIEKPSVSSFKQGRKLFFLPVIYSSDNAPEDFSGLTNKYWDQADKQLDELTTKLGAVKRIYHELVDSTGEQGLDLVKELNDKSYMMIKSLTNKGAELEAFEDTEILTEYMDWNRCLMIGLQNSKVISKIYESYTETGKKRNSRLTKIIDDTLQPNEIGLLMMRENHQVQFSTNIQIFYISPPALDEIKRFIREQETKAKSEESSK